MHSYESQVQPEIEMPLSSSDIKRTFFGMANVPSASVPSQQPPQLFIRKARASHRKSLCAESALTLAQSEAGADQKDRQETIEKCPWPRNSSSRAQYNRLIGQMIGEEAQSSLTKELCIDFARLEELFLQLSDD
jgi:hypothetical protein